jgi:hypothetical protein
MITKIAPDGPAFRTQLIQVGDLLVQVDDRLLDGMQIDDVRKCITGPPNSKISLHLLRPHVNVETVDETGYEEFDPISVRLRRSAAPQRIFPDVDMSPRDYDGKPKMSYAATNGSHDSFAQAAQPIIGQSFAQFTPSNLQVQANY